MSDSSSEDDDFYSFLDAPTPAYIGVPEHTTIFLVQEVTMSENSTIKLLNGSVTLVLRNQIEKSVAYVKKILEDGVRLETGIFNFDYLSKEASNIDKFTLLYDINVRNSDVTWRRYTERNSTTQTYFTSTLKDDFMLGRDIQYNFPDIYDYTLAVEMASKKVNLLCVFPSTIDNRNYRNIFSRESLKERYFPKFEMSDDTIRHAICSGALLSYVENEGGRSPVVYDNNCEYVECTLPLDENEAQIYEYDVMIFNSIHMGVNDAIASNFLINIGDIVTVHVRNFELLKTMTDLSNIPVRRDQSIEYNREIYSLDLLWKNRAKNMIMAGINVSLYVLNTDLVLQPIASRFSVSTNVVTVLTAALSNLSPMVVSDIVVAMCTVYSNPNVSYVTFTEKVTLDIRIEVLFGILVAQTLFSASVVSLSNRRFVNNYIALYIVRDCCHDVDLPQNLRFTGSYSSWLSSEDKLYDVARNYNIMHNEVQNFLTLYLRDSIAHIVMRPRYGPTSLDIPWGDGGLADVINTIPLFDNAISRRFRLILPATPYPLENLMEFQGQRLNALITAMGDMVSSSRGPLKSTIGDRYSKVFVDKVDSLSGLFRLLVTRLPLVSSLPYADNVVRGNLKRGKNCYSS